MPKVNTISQAFCQYPHELMKANEDAGQSYKEGALVYLNNGRLRECGNDPPTIAGIANSDAVGTAGAERSFYPANAINTFVMNVYFDNTGANNQNNAIIESDRGRNYGVVKIGNCWVVDKSDVVNVRVRVIDKYPGDAWGDFYGRAIVQVLPNNRQLFT